MLRFVLIILSFMTICEASSSEDQKKNGVYIPSIIPTKEEVLRVKQNDIIIGDPKAKNTLIEYSSLACPHCAEYYRNIFPKINTELINKSKVKYIYRDFPTTRSALRGTALIRCISLDKNGDVNADEFFRLLQTLFNSQSSWAFSNNYEENLGKILGIIGVSQNIISKCMQNNDIATDIVSNSFVAMKALHMLHSPAIFINGVEVLSVDYDNIASIIK